MRHYCTLVSSASSVLEDVPVDQLEEQDEDEDEDENEDKTENK